MSQFQNPYEEPGAPTTTSKLAVASFVSSLIFFCPITTLLGPLLGLIALATMGARKGRVFAVLGILIGVLLSTGWGVGINWMVGKGKEVYAAMMEGPNAALTAGFAGDPDGFRAAFYGAGASMTDAEVAAFIDELRSRYGDFVVSTLDEQQSTQPKPGEAQASFSYVLDFTNEQVNAEAEIIFADQTTGQFVMQLGSLLVLDPDRGDLVYPGAP